MIKSLIAAILAVTATAAPAQIANKAKIGGWQIYQVEGRPNCSMMSLWGEAITIRIDYDVRDGFIQAQIMDSNWRHFREGETYRGYVAVDNITIVDAFSGEVPITGVQTSEATGFEFEVPANVFLQTLAAGRVLEFHVGGVSHALQLRRTRDAALELIRCSESLV